MYNSYITIYAYIHKYIFIYVTTISGKRGNEFKKEQGGVSICFALDLLEE